MDQTLELILFNLIQSTLALEYQMPHGEGTESDFICRAKPIVFCFYSMALLCVLCVHRLYFFVTDDWAWNCFDVIRLVPFLRERSMQLLVPLG